MGATMNTVTCADCGHTDTRGNMHIRTRLFVQVAFCPPCWKASHSGRAAEKAAA